MTLDDVELWYAGRYFCRLGGLYTTPQAAEHIAAEQGFTVWAAHPGYEPGPLTNNGDVRLYTFSDAVERALTWTDSQPCEGAVFVRDSTGEIVASVITDDELDLIEQFGPPSRRKGTTDARDACRDV